MGGVTLEALYAFGGQAGDFRRNSSIDAGASYSSGQVYLGAAYFYVKNPATQFPDGNTIPVVKTRDGSAHQWIGAE